ncbi:MAG: hypothetical protein AAF614_35870 [Chloroflexota bacterium]
MGTSPDSLAALQHANERLLALRQQRQVDVVRVPFETEEKTAVSTSPPTTTAIIDTLPAHLGWGSSVLTAVHRPSTAQASHPQPEPALQTSQFTVSHETITTTNANKNLEQTFNDALPDTADQTVKLYPDIARAMLRQEVANAGRLWLALRHIDQKSQGWLRIVDIREKLTTKTAVNRLCGWRQMRNLLREGDAIFWQRDKERVWLYGVEKVAQKLQISRLTGLPIKLPLTHLFSGISVFRAHLYASIHSGRRRGNPISRERLAQLSGVTPRTQRQYDRIAKVKRTKNIAIGQRAANVSWETIGWEQGRGAFPLKDVNGRLGHPNETYIAWQLPNNYVGPHQQCARGRQKKINQKLVDLVHEGMRGNGRSDSEPSSAPDRLYFHNAGTAVLHCQQQNHVYWPSAVSNRSTQLWHSLNA